MPTARFTCNICSCAYSTEEEACQCEAHETPVFRHPIGWKIFEYHGDFYAIVTEHKVASEEGKHIPKYGIVYQDPYSWDKDPSILSLRGYFDEEILDKSDQRGFWVG